MVDEEPELLVLHQLLVDEVEELLPLLRLQLQVMEEDLGGDVLAAEGGEVEEALQAVRRRHLEAVEELVDRIEERLGGQRLEIQAQALGPRGHPVVGIGGGAGDGEDEAGVAPGLVEQPAAQGVGELGAVDGVHDQVAVPAQRREQAREGGPGVGRARRELLPDRRRIVQPQEQGGQGRAGERDLEELEERQDPLAQGLAAGLAKLQAFGDLDLGEAGEIETLLVAVEVEAEHGGPPPLQAGALGRRLQQAGAAAPGLAGEDEDRRRPRRGEDALDRREGLGRVLVVEPVFLFGGQSLEFVESDRHGSVLRSFARAAGRRDAGRPESWTPMLWDGSGGEQTGIGSPPGFP